MRKALPVRPFKMKQNGMPKAKGETKADHQIARTLFAMKRRLDLSPAEMLKAAATLAKKDSQ